ncbi:MAG: dockerin type I domain-containing protein, partial [Gammaproteobacteria bacterium]
SALMSNLEAPVPPQCYTNISEGVGFEGRHNPCYACHQNEIPGRENKQNDRDLQEAYSFSDVGLTNHWFNLFEDRSARVAAISDAEILTWIDQDNYSELAGRLQAAGWGNDNFPGFGTDNPAVFGTPWLPDLANLQEGAAAFDEHGLALDGSWWVAFNYKPLPSTFWPTNGSTDDVMIRLAPDFWKTQGGADSLDVYRANLALVEANTKGVARMSALPINEQAMNQDVDGDGVLETEVTEVAIDTNVKTTVEGPRNFYVGKAGDSEFIEPSMYPLGTEFLHTVRYVGVDDQGQIKNARRMKEVRYMRRFYRGRLFDAAALYNEEAIEKELGALPTFTNHGHSGLAKRFGWQITGFIEAYDGRLRWNTYEENAFCMGCHSSIGSTIDKTFSFGRKVDGASGWGYINLKGMRDTPNIGELKSEIQTYLERVGGGTEFRSNPELEARFYKADGVSLNTVAVASAKDTYDFITPSRDRALALNKAYKVIVEDQDFIFGRDATASPPTRVLAAIDNENSPTLPPELQHDWNLVLDWSNADASRCMYTGDVDFADLSGPYVAKLAGTSPEQHGRVCANGTVALRGELRVELAEGYVPQVGDRFELVKSDTLEGDFDGTVLPSLPHGFFKLKKDNGSLLLVVAIDSDLDGASDDEDNCTQVANGPLIPDARGKVQLDSDGDGYGNLCDADLNNDGVVNGGDLGPLRTALGGSGGAADLNGDGAVNAGDIGALRARLGTLPGPSGIAP